MNYADVIEEIFSQFDGPRFAIKLWDGKERHYGTGSTTKFTLIIDDVATAQRLLSQGALGFGESYMEGKIRIEGDIEAYLRLRHQFKHVRRSLKLILATFLATRQVPKKRKDQISYHYDLGNDFFKMFLDKETMSYSAGRYKGGSEDLEKAQQNKFKMLTDWLNLPPDSSVLDLGSGWGGFAQYAAMNKKWHITGYTLSRAQLQYCQKLAKTSNTERLVSFEYKDMLVEFPKKQFDGIVMIESFEHIGKKNISQFFNNLFTALKPGGTLAIQLTGRYTPRSIDLWTLKYVFPGGYLPTKEELINAASQAGFSIEEFRDDTTDYIITMTEWIKRLEGHREDIEQKYDKPFYRLWELWMHGAKVAFEVDSMNLFRMRLKR